MNAFHPNNTFPFITSIFLMLIFSPSSGQVNFWGGIEDEIKFNHLQTEQGLSSNVTSCVYQDRDGFIWIGTDAGLNRFDGFKIKNFKYGPNIINGLSNGVIKCITQDKRGLLWIGTEWGLNVINTKTNEIKYFLSNEGSSETLSNNVISSITEDKNGTLWIGTFSGLNKLREWDDNDSPTFQRIKNDPNNEFSLSNNRIFSIFCDQQNNLWIGTEGGGLNFLSEQNRKNELKFIHFGTDPFDQYSISNDIVYSISEDSKGDMYVGTDNGFNTISINKNDTIISSFYADKSKSNWLQENKIFSILPIQQNKVLIGSFGGGLHQFNSKDESFSVYRYNYYNPKSLSRDYIYHLYASKEDIIWLATRETGIDWIDPDNQRFMHLRSVPNNQNSLSSGIVKAIEEDTSGRFWFGTFGGGLNLYDPATQSFLFFEHDVENQGSISSNIVESLCYDHLGRLWIGTSEGLCLLDERNNHFVRFQYAPNNINSLPNNYIWDISPSKKKDGLWLATYDGLCKYDWKENKFFRFRNEPENPHSLSFNFLRSVVEDEDNNIWVCTWGGGLDKLSLQENKDLDNARFEHFKHVPGDSTSLSNDLVNILFIDSKGHKWVGTQGGLARFNERTESFTTYTVNEGLVDNVVKGILEDLDGNLWISTQKGLSKFDPESKRFNNFFKEDGLQSDVFNLSACLQNTRGELMFGGNNGVSIFRPEKIKERITTPTILIDHINVNNIRIGSGKKINGRFITVRTLHEMDVLELKYDENVITFEFTAIEYSSPERVEFSYRLEGVDRQWNSAQYNERQVTYSNLQAGEYLFRLRATNKNKTWGHQEKLLKVIIRPPVWATHFAYIIYTLIVIGILFVILYNIRNRIKIKRELAVEKEVHRRKMEIEEFKLRFFTNVSHDIKTPLTLISVPLQRLIKEFGRISEAQQLRYLNTMNKSVQMLIKLVNQLLYFRKLENKKLLLEVSKSDLAVFIKDHANAFIDIAEEKNIQFDINIPSEERICLFDHKIIDKIIFNLISNAFKFTPVGGKVSVEFHAKRYDTELNKENISAKYQYYGFTIKDSGIGIPEEKMNTIFKRFEQLESGKDMGVGTGIGLAIVKRLVEIHKGRIEVKSTPGSGSSFTVWIPVDDEAYDRTEIAEQEDIQINDSIALPNTDFEEIHFESPATDQQKNETAELHNKISILVIEDYSEMRLFIKDILKSKYQIIEAENGKIGYEKALLEGPDLIITDVMMPEMNGMELVKRIKKNVNISHIPIIMLTARNTIENEIEGLETGVNYFIKKPFNVDQLKLVVRNTLEYRKELQRKFSSSKIPEPKDINVTSVDEKLLQKIVETLEENISNTDFTVEDLAKETGLSPVHLYRKFKFLTGMSSSDFIKSFRMKRAAQLLKKDKLRISEVAYAVGFNDPRYFRKCFKIEFGMSPSDFASEQKDDNNSNTIS